MKNNINIFLISIVVFISRLPFIFNSPGSDMDSWRILYAGKLIHQSGVYHISRLPGYPISEYIASLCWDNFVILNLISVVFIILSSVYFYKILNLLNVNLSLLATFALAFTQGIYSTSTTNMDYVWSLCFLIFTFYSLLRKNFLFSGVFFGIMVGLRLTNVIILPAFLYYIYVQENHISKKIFYFILSFIIVLLLIFSPVFLEYGINVFPENTDWRGNFKSIFSLYWLYNFGFLGLLGIGIAFYLIIKKINKDNFEIHYNVIVFSILLIFFNMVMFLRFPYESAYVIPAIPFYILLISLLIDNKILKKIIYSLILVSPFLFHISTNGMKLKGDLWVNENIENAINKYNIELSERLKTIKEKKKLLVMGGSFYVYAMKNPLNTDSLKVLNAPKKDLLLFYKKEGYEIYYSVDAIDEIQTKEHYNISNYGSEIIGKLKFDR